MGKAHSSAPLLLATSCILVDYQVVPKDSEMIRSVASRHSGRKTRHGKLDRTLACHCRGCGFIGELVQTGMVLALSWWRHVTWNSARPMRRGRAEQKASGAELG